ncbi:MAG: septum formation initiator family protein [Kiloniellales bacterium]
MALMHEIRRRARQAAPQALFACTLAYFAYHAVHGDRGIMAWVTHKDELAQARILQAELAAERAAWEHKVGLLRGNPLDADLLDERARLLLNYGRPDELVVLLKPQK